MRVALRSWLLASCAAMSATACVTEATSLLVIVDTDIPPDLSLTVRVTARAGDVSISDGRRDVSWNRIALDAGPSPGAFALPASFGVRPNGPRDQLFTLLVEGVTGRYTVRRSIRARFTPGRSLRLPVFLSARCGEPATDCTSVPAAMCTVQQSCEERMQTCGNAGTCVSVGVQPIDPRATDASGATDSSANDSAATSGCGQGRSCCTAGAICGAGETCTSLDNCAVCGEGHACCESGSLCPVNHVCSDGACRPCGAADGPCCDGERCSAGTCVTGMCQTGCGAPGQPCCANSACGGVAVCNGFNCACTRSCNGRCGGASDGCGGVCDSGCGIDEVCANQRCSRCGVLGSPCCPGNDCSGASQTAFCCTPATEGRPTCPLGGSDGICHVCGNVAQPCCAHQTCNNTGQSTCGGSAEANNVLCRSENCGVQGGFCCTWRVPACDNGMACDFSTGRCR